MKTFSTFLFLALGWTVVIIGIDLAVLVAGFSFSVIDAAFGDAKGSAFWIDFLQWWPNVTKLIP